MFNGKSIQSRSALEKRCSHLVGIEKGQKVTISTNFHKSCTNSTKKAAICTHADSRLWFYAVFYFLSL